MPDCCRHVAANLGQRTPFASELNIDNTNMGGTAKSSATRATTDGNGPRQAVATLHEAKFLTTESAELCQLIGDTVFGEPCGFEEMAELVEAERAAKPSSALGANLDGLHVLDRIAK